MSSELVSSLTATQQWNSLLLNIDLSRLALSRLTLSHLSHHFGLYPPVEICVKDVRFTLFATDCPFTLSFLDLRGSVLCNFVDFTAMEEFTDVDLTFYYEEWQFGPILCSMGFPIACLKVTDDFRTRNARASLNVFWRYSETCDPLGEDRFQLVFNSCLRVGEHGFLHIPERGGEWLDSFLSFKLSPTFLSLHTMPKDMSVGRAMWRYFPVAGSTMRCLFTGRNNAVPWPVLLQALEWVASRNDWQYCLLLKLAKNVLVEDRGGLEVVYFR